MNSTTPGSRRPSTRLHNRHRRRPSLEALESLCLMSVDLLVTNIAATSPTALAQGETVSLSYTIKNQGTTTAVQTNTYDDFYFSTKPIFDNTAQRLTYGDNRGRDAYPLAAGASYTRSYTYGPPRGTAPGTYYLFVFADTGNQQPESDETNNVSAPLAFTYIALPDLVVTNIATTSPTALAQGQAVSLNYTIKNQGTNTAVQTNTYDDLYLSTKPTFDNTAQRLTYGDSRGRDAFPLAPGASYTRSYTYGPPRGTAPGTYYLFVFADTGNNLDESDETNNTSPAVSFTYIALPDLVVTNIATTGDTALAQGQAVSLNYTIKNQGTNTAVQTNTYDDLYLSTKPIFDNTAQRLTYGDSRGRDAFPLAPGASYTRSYTYGPPRGTAPGTYYLFVFADTGNNLDESDETNNTSPAVSFTYIALPDLVVTNIATTGDTALAQGQAVSLNYTIKNQGTNTAVQTNTYDDLYLSTKPIFDNTAQRLTYGDSRGRDAFPLAPGASYTRSYTYGPPRGTAPGTYYLFVFADTGNNLDESDETNNTSPAVSFTYIALPDLVVTNISGPSGPIVPGEPFTLNYTIKNQGTNTAVQTNTYDDLYLSTKPTFDNTAQRLTYGDSRGRDAFPLAPGASYTRSYTYSLPRSSAPGTYYLYVVADTGNNLDESDETNNVSAPFVINPNAPDLLVTSFTGPATAVAGEAFGLSWTVKNQGDIPASNASIVDQVYYSTKATFDSTAVALGSAYLRPNAGTPIASGASYTQSVSATLPGSLPPGVYYLYVKTDANNTQAEFNETNNVSAPLTVATDKPDLVVATFTGPTAPIVPGESLRLSWTVKNQGTVAAGAAFIEDQVYYSTSATFDASAIPLGSAYPRPNAGTPIAAGASYTQTVDTALPAALAPGTYYLYVKTDNRDFQVETNETNNVSSPLTVAADKPDLVVTSLVGPDTGVVPGTPFSLTWVVKNQGTIAANSSLIADQLYYSAKPTFDSSAIAFGPSTTRPDPTTPIAAGGSYTQTVTANLPSSLAAGTYYLYVRTDNLNSQVETDETNNVSAPFSTSPNRPNLTLTAVTATPTTIVPGTTASVAWTVKNVGSVAAGGTWTDGVYLSADATFDSSDIVLRTLTRPNALASGDSYNQATTVTLPGTVNYGKYYLLIVTDAGSDQAESDETDNVSAVAISLVSSGATPAITVSPTSGLRTTKSGGSTTFSVVLASRPDSDVVVPVSSSNPSEGTVSTTSLTFTRANWSSPRTVTVQGINDGAVGDVSYQIVFGAAVTADPAYQGLTPPPITVVNVDDIARNPIPTVTDFVVNDGAAQRSKVNSLTLRFNSVVTLAAGAISVVDQADGSSVGVTTSLATVNGKTEVTVTFTGDGIVGGSLADGRYTLTMDATKVTDAANQNPATNYTADFFRLFGDANGDGGVDNADAYAFRQTFGTKATDVGYLWYLDYDGDGTIDRATDAAQLTARNRKKV